MLEGEWVTAPPSSSSFPSPTATATAATATQDRVKDGSGDLEHLCAFVEDMIKYICAPLLSSPDIDLFWSQKNSSHQQEQRQMLHSALTSSTPWTSMTYTEAIKELQAYPAKAWEFQPRWGAPLQSEHERFLAETLVKGPVFVTRFPEGVKPFYMRVSDGNGEASDNGKGTVECFDLLVPHVYELAGGSVREERLDVLQRRMAKTGMDPASLEWYLDLRRYGSSPTVGFGLGFERLVAWLGGIESVRECVAMPRWVGRLGL